MNFLSFQDIPIGKAHSAQNICAGLFVSNVSEDKLLQGYVGPEVKPLPALWDVDIDRDDKTVTVSDAIFKDKHAATAVYRPGFGCTLAHGKSRAELKAQTPEQRPQIDLPEHRPWPEGTGGVDDSARARVDQYRTR